jgi:hypothetical protein
VTLRQRLIIAADAMMVAPVPSAAANTAIMCWPDPNAGGAANRANMRTDANAAGTYAGSGADAPDVDTRAYVLGHGTW